VMLGDVVVSVDTAILESKKIGEPLHATIYRLLIHGLLHLLDYDHERSPEAAQQMEKEEQRLFRLIKEG
jgi:rRNA maturation RNase YbeY